MKLTTIKMEAADCFWSDLFTQDELDQIEQYCNTFDMTPGTINTDNGENTTVRKSNVAWINRNQDCEWFFSKIESAVNKINTRFFGFDIYHLRQMQYTLYNEEGSHYDWHWDMYYSGPFEGDTPMQRKVSAVLQLSNPEDYEGGELELSPGGLIKSIPKQRGYLSVFPGFIVHRVTPIISGERKTLVAWFSGPDWR